jgi:branched-chain amino acid transport system permease protein
MDTELLIQLVINAVMIGTIYVLVGLGLTLIFSIMNVVNFAHGEMYMLGGFLTYFVFFRFFVEQLHIWIYPAYFITVVLAVLFLGLFGFFLEKAIFRPFRGDLLAGLMVSLGLSMVLQMSSALSFGVRDLNVPSVFHGVIRIFGASMSKERVVVILLAGLIFWGLHLFIQKTRLGLAIRAIAQNKEAAQLQGMNFATISSFGFAIGCALAGVAGVLIVPVAFVSPFVGSGYLMKAFILIIVGGMGSFPGCVLAGLILGIIESFGSFYFSLHAAALLSFAMIIVILIIRPQGLMGRVEK